MINKTIFYLQNKIKEVLIIFKGSVYKQITKKGGINQKLGAFFTKKGDQFLIGSKNQNLGALE